MRLLVALEGRSPVEEVLDAEPTTLTVEFLRSTVESNAVDRLGFDVVAKFSLPDGRQLPEQPPHMTLASLGIGHSDCIACSISPALRIYRCEPPHGPVAGGTLVHIRGSGFSQGSFGDGSARVSFGAGCTVPCWRGSDAELLCHAPPHAEGIVTVTLVGCEAAGFIGVASYEFATEGRLCDLIFSTTNAHCPLRDGAYGAVGAAADDLTHDENYAGPRLLR